MKVTFTTFNILDHLQTEEEMKTYLQICMEEDGIKGLQHALGVIAKAKGMNEIAQKSGLGRQNLYKALSADSSPKFDTINRVVEALGLKLTVV